MDRGIDSKQRPRPDLASSVETPPPPPAIGFSKSAGSPLIGLKRVNSRNIDLGASPHSPFQTPQSAVIAGLRYVHDTTP